MSDYKFKEYKEMIGEINNTIDVLIGDLSDVKEQIEEGIIENLREARHNDLIE